MKKGMLYCGIVRELDFPNKGIVEVQPDDTGKNDGCDGQAVTIRKDQENGSGEMTESVPAEVAVVKNAMPGQTVSFVVNKKRGGKCEGRLVEVKRRADCEKPETECPLAGICGGCIYQGFPYEETLKIKEGQIRKLLAPFVSKAVYDGITPSPLPEGYRNKMEYTFGDACKGGELTLGLHKRGSFYDICSAGDCRITDEDFGKIVRFTEDYFRKKGIPYFHRQRHGGILRHLLVRKAAKTGELLVALVTVSGEKDLTKQDEQSFGIQGVSAGKENESVQRADNVGLNCVAQRADKEYTGRTALNTESSDSNNAWMERWETEGRDTVREWSDGICALKLSGEIAGILHISNDHLADAILCDDMEVLYGRDFFTEELLGLRFRISPFSFFQTNSLGAEKLYSRVRDYVSTDGDGATVYDLYSGTGTIAQLLAPAAKKVIGVEIVEEAVVAARENARENGLSNCEFIAGDVLKVLDEIEEKPDYIILDPPRDGVHPKALRKILDYGVEHMVYISCKPTSLQRDLPMIEAAGYRVVRWGLTDMFPYTGNIETVVLLGKNIARSKSHVNVK